MLFVQGSRDAFGTPEELQPIIRDLGSARRNLSSSRAPTTRSRWRRKSGSRNSKCFNVILDHVAQWLRAIGRRGEVPDREARPTPQTRHIRVLTAARYDGAAMIHVCSLARLHTTVEETGAHHVVTLLGVEDDVRLPATVPAGNHLRLHVHDIAGPMDGYVTPRRRARRAASGTSCAAGAAMRRW